MHAILPPRKASFEYVRIDNKLRKEQLRRKYTLKNQSKEQIPLLKTQNLPQLAERRLSRTMQKTIFYCQAAKSCHFPISEDLCATEGTSLREAEPKIFHCTELWHHREMLNQS